MKKQWKKLLVLALTLGMMFSQVQTNLLTVQAEESDVTTTSETGTEPTGEQEPEESTEPTDEEDPEATTEPTGEEDAQKPTEPTGEEDPEETTDPANSSGGGYFRTR